MFLEIASHVAVNGSFQAYEHRGEIAKAWGKFVYFIKHGKLSILVVGPGGVGKSTLSGFLADPAQALDPAPYNESFHVERRDFSGNVVAELLTTPGQQHYGSWDELFEKTKGNGNRFGIIHVVSYGYHSTMLGMRETREQNETSQARILRYLGECRAKEIAVAQDLVKRLERHGQPFWMMTLVTKQDLWWQNRQNVERHYREGEYAEAIRQINNAHVAQDFRHEYFSMALHSQNFCDGAGTVMIETASGYDDVIKYRHHRKFLEILNGFIG